MYIVSSDKSFFVLSPQNKTEQRSFYFHSAPETKHSLKISPRVNIFSKSAPKTKHSLKICTIQCNQKQLIQPETTHATQLVCFHLFSHIFTRFPCGYVFRYIYCANTLVKLVFHDLLNRLLNAALSIIVEWSKIDPNIFSDNYVLFPVYHQ